MKKFERFVQFYIGETVYLKTDTQQLPRIVIGIKFGPKDALYYLVQGEKETIHFDHEMSQEQDISLKTSY